MTDTEKTRQHYVFTHQKNWHSFSAGGKNNGNMKITACFEAFGACFSVNLDLDGIRGESEKVDWGEWNEAQLCRLYGGIINTPHDSPLRMNSVVGLRLDLAPTLQSEADGAFLSGCGLMTTS